MKKTTRWATMLIATATTAVLVSGCAANGQPEPEATEPITLTFMRTGTPEILHPIFDPIIEEFEKQNPNITIDMQDLGWADAATSLSVMGASKTLPDVMYHLPGTVFDMAQKGLVLDLTGKLSDELTSDIYPALLEAGQYDGKQYLVPSGASTLLLWYNADLFEAAGLDPDSPPATWEEMLADAQKIQAATGVAGLGIYSKPAGGETSFVMESLFASQVGGSAWDSKNNEYLYDDPSHTSDATATLQFMQDMVGAAQPSVVEYGRFDTRPL
ncbi:MAG: extracellular solute-binding protein, partial [Microbacterium sp.]